MFWMADGDAPDRGPTDDFWYEALGFSAGSSGVRVTPDSSLRLPAVYACVRVITDAVMQVPLILYRRDPNNPDDKVRATDDHRYMLLHDRPNDRFTAPEWREVMQHHLLLRGNAYAKKIEDGRGDLVELGDPWHPDYVRAEIVRDSQNMLRVKYTFKPRTPLEREEILLDHEVLHIRGLTLDGVTGISPIQAEREAVGLGISAQLFLERYFGNDARPGGVIESPKTFPSKAARERFREQFEDALRGQHRHKTAVLEYGMKYTPLELKLVDQQFLELRKYQNHEIARIFRVPPHMIMEMDRSTFSNIEHQSIEFVKNTMLPWLVRWEKRLNASLLGGAAGDGLFFEFLVDGLERGDIKSRTAHYQSAIQNGYMTRNEVRRRENMNGLDGLDEPLQPLNMVEAGQEPEEPEDMADAPDNERMAQLEQNASGAIARKQAAELRKLRSADNGRGRDPHEFLARGVDQVAQMMALPVDVARSVMADAARDLRDDGVSIEDWTKRQAARLIEASRSL